MCFVCACVCMCEGLHSKILNLIGKSKRKKKKRKENVKTSTFYSVFAFPGIFYYLFIYFTSYSNSVFTGCFIDWPFFGVDWIFKWWIGKKLILEWNPPAVLSCHLTHQLFPSSATKYTVSVTTLPTPFWTGIYLFVYSFLNPFCWLTLQPFLAFSCVLEHHPFLVLLFQTYL